MTHLGKIAARILYDKFFQMNVEGRFHRPTIYDQKRSRPFGKFYYVHEEELQHKIVGKRRRQPKVIYVTYYDFGKVYDRRGKR